MDLGPAERFRNSLHHRPIQRSFTLPCSSVQDDKTQFSSQRGMHPVGEENSLWTSLRAHVPSSKDDFYYRFWLDQSEERVCG